MINDDPFLNELDGYFDQLEASITELRGEIKALSAQRYVGLHSPAAEYLRGNIVTHKGTLWHCNTDATRDRPGTSAHWTLMAKNGSGEGER